MDVLKENKDEKVHQLHEKMYRIRHVSTPILASNSWYGVLGIEERIGIDGIVISNLNGTEGLRIDGYWH